MLKLLNLTALGSATLSSLIPTACCWGPSVLTSVAGFSGTAAHFSWVYPLRPYLFGLAFISLAFSFYRAYNKSPRETGDHCPNCETKKPGFVKSKWYLWAVAAFVLSMFLLNYFPELYLN